MPIVRCGKEPCTHRHNGMCELPYIYLQSEKCGSLVKCGGFELDAEYNKALTLLGQNPRLSAERGEEVE